MQSLMTTIECTAVPFQSRMKQDIEQPISLLCPQIHRYIYMSCTTIKFEIGRMGNDSAMSVLQTPATAARKVVKYIIL